MGREFAASYLDRCGVSIDTQKLSTGCTSFQNGSGVPPTSQSTIHITPPGLNRQCTDDLIKQDRSMGRCRHIQIQQRFSRLSIICQACS